MSTDDLITLVVFSGLELLAGGTALICGVLLVTRLLKYRSWNRIQGEIVGHRTVQTFDRSSALTLEQPIVRAQHEGEEVELLHPMRSNVVLPVGTPVLLDVHPQRAPDGSLRIEVASGLVRYLAPVTVGLATSFFFVLLVLVELSVLL